MVFIPCTEPPQGLSVVNWNCAFQNGTSSPQCGNLVNTATTGPTGSLTYAMTNLIVGETYNVSVTIEKVEGSITRSVNASVNIVVVAGDPAQVTIMYVACPFMFLLAVSKLTQLVFLSSL